MQQCLCAEAALWQGLCFIPLCRGLAGACFSNSCTWFYSTCDVTIHYILTYDMIIHYIIHSFPPCIWFYSTCDHDSVNLCDVTFHYISTYDIIINSQFSSKISTMSCMISYPIKLTWYTLWYHRILRATMMSYWMATKVCPIISC